jgi:hypothetical protein
LSIEGVPVQIWKSSYKIYIIISLQKQTLSLKFTEVNVDNNLRCLNINMINNYLLEELDLFRSIYNKYLKLINL